MDFQKKCMTVRSRQIDGQRSHACARKRLPAVRPQAGGPSESGCLKAQNMQEETSFVICEGIVLPESVLRRRERTPCKAALDIEDGQRMVAKTLSSGT